MQIRHHRQSHTRRQKPISRPRQAGRYLRWFICRTEQNVLGMFDGLLSFMVASGFQVIGLDRFGLSTVPCLHSAAKHGRVSIRAGLDIGLTSARRASTKPYPLRNCSGLRPKSLTRLGREAPRSITGDTRLRPNRNGYISDFRQPSRRRPVRHDIPRRDQHSCAGVNRRSVTRTEAPRPCVPEPGKPAGAVECRLFAAAARFAPAARLLPNFDRLSDRNHFPAPK